MRRVTHPNKLIAFAFAAVLAGTATSALAEQTDTPQPNTSGYSGGYGPGMMNGYGPGYGPGMMNGYGQGYGPGMMNGYGPGYGRGMMNGYGPGYGPGMMGGYGQGYGPGMMNGYGPGYGPGMMGGYGQGYGPGMMGGYGPGYGRGMMNGYGPGYGMMNGYGPGMMGGYGPGYGPGMMGGYGPGFGPGARGGAARNPLSLSNDQRSKIYAIQNQTRKSNWALMGQIQDQQAKIGELSEAPSPDNAAIEKAEKDISKLQQQMYQNAVEAHKKMDEVLTKEQKEKLQSNWQQ